ncbi:hypothetical protein ACIP2X_18620 [Streptomyces sp. NPDC089424]|uniref:hypothetical protein n=1 Tax=Streptomyces sp. NPDC089424 TaxID=3365917 RepID=UPI0037FEF0F3
MQRPTPRQTTVAAASALTGGAVVTTTAYRDELDSAVIDVTCGLLPVACATTVVLTVVRRWLNQHEASTTNAVTRLLTQQETKQDELLARERALAHKERMQRRLVYTTDLRVRSAWHRSDDLMRENRELRSRLGQLEIDLQEVSREHNELVGEVLRQRGSVFTQRTTGSATIIRGADDERSRPTSTIPRATACPGRDDEEVIPVARRRGRPESSLPVQHNGPAAREHNGR